MKKIIFSVLCFLCFAGCVVLRPKKQNDWQRQHLSGRVKSYIEAWYLTDDTTGAPNTTSKPGNLNDVFYGQIKTRYLFDKKGMITAMDELTNDNKVYQHHTYKYTLNNRHLDRVWEEWSTNNAGRFVFSRISYFLNRTGLVDSILTYDGNDLKLSRKNKTLYHANGDHEDYYYRYDEDSGKFVVDSYSFCKGNNAEFKQYNGISELVETRYRTFNNNGEPLSQINLRKNDKNSNIRISRRRFIYEAFDKYGNWTQSREIAVQNTALLPVLVAVHKRVYVYY